MNKIQKIRLFFAFIALFSAQQMICAQTRSDSVHVENYTVNLSITDFSNKTIEGRTDIKLFSKIDNLQKVRLSLMQLTVDSVYVANQPAQYQHVNQDLFVDLPILQTGDSVLINVYYHGTPAHDNNFGGFYFNGQYAYSVGVALDDQPHNYGRCWFPCVEEFTDKSSYNFNIQTTDGKIAICNGILTDSTTTENGNRLWSWKLDQKIPTYLASVAVGNYVCYSDTVHGLNDIIPIAIYTPPAINPNVNGSFMHLKKIFRMFEEKFGAYPWPRIGYVTTAMTGGAMEHATNIAYPNLFVNGNLTYESVYAHELFHHWFGDLITCEKPEEMWINEGFASFSEPLIDGFLYSNDSTDNYIRHIRNTRVNVLNNIVKTDGCHFALDAVPQDVTYGLHSYSKGELVIHSLRSYMGDSLFFGGLKQLLTDFAFQNINSETFFTALSAISGYDLSDFYNDWIHQPGFFDFEVADLQAHGCGIFSVKVRQSGFGTEHFGTNIPIDITFVSQNGEFYTVENQMLTDEYTEFAIFVPFTPVFAILNKNDKLADAGIDGETTFTEPKNVNFSDVLCSVSVQNISDSAYFRVENHYTSPKSQNIPNGIHKLSNTHYWTVRYSGGDLSGNMTFRLNKASNKLDYELFTGGDYTLDNLKLLYRLTENDDWQIVPFTRSGTPLMVNVKVNDIFPGQYCFAVGDVDASINDLKISNISLFPNPAYDNVIVKSNIEFDRIFVYDTAGKKVKTAKCNSNPYNLDVSNFKSGNYVITIYKNKTSVARTQFLKK